MPEPSPKRRGGALAVGAGIFLSRIFGLVRERALSHYLGNSEAAGAFRAALRIPNLLQNLLGEGVLSASFIPVYARLLAEGREEEASRVARAVGTLLGLVAALVTLLGVGAAPWLVDAIAPGFSGETRDLTVTLVRVLFPGTALLVLSAWCLGVLNSHRRFFLSYASPVLWNLAIIAAALLAGRRTDSAAELVTWIAWGAVAGSALQLLVQVPGVFGLLGSLRPSLATDAPGVRQTMSAFGPVLIGRGSVQLSAYLDQFLSSFLGASMVSAIAYAQTLYLLPVSLFGMAVSAAELPEMASATGSDAERQDKLRARLAGSGRQIAFLVVPSAVAFVAIGPALVGALFQSGEFGAHDTQVVWWVLLGSTLGLLPTTLGRLNASAFYALGDTRTPLRFALLRVALSASLGSIAVFPLRSALGYSVVDAGLALCLASSLASLVEFVGLRAALDTRIGRRPSLLGFVAQLFGFAGVAGVVAFFVDRQLGLAPLARAALVAPLFGAIYLGLAHLAGLPEARRFTRRLRR